MVELSLVHYKRLKFEKLIVSKIYVKLGKLLTRSQHGTHQYFTRNDCRALKEAPRLIENPVNIEKRLSESVVRSTGDTEQRSCGYAWHHTREPRTRGGYRVYNVGKRRITNGAV